MPKRQAAAATMRAWFDWWPPVVIRTSDEFVGRAPLDPAEAIDALDRNLIVRSPASRLPAADEEISVVFDPTRVCLFDAGSGAAL